jgi:hypothetical protein
LAQLGQEKGSKTGNCAVAEGEKKNENGNKEEDGNKKDDKDDDKEDENRDDGVEREKEKTEKEGDGLDKDEEKDGGNNKGERTHSGVEFEWDDNYKTESSEGKLSSEIIGACVGATVLIVLTIVVGIFLIRKGKRRAQSHDMTVSAPALQNHIVGEAIEVTGTTTFKLKTDNPAGNTSDAEAPLKDLPSAADPIYATISKTPPKEGSQVEDEDEDLYSKVNKKPEHADALTGGPEIRSKHNESECAYADLEFVGRKREDTGSLVMKVTSIEPTYITITDFQRAEDDDEGLDGNHIVI